MKLIDDTTIPKHKPISAEMQKLQKAYGRINDLQDELKDQKLLNTILFVSNFIMLIAFLFA